ncbi:hypothetical protein A2755_02385 [Candidatus Wolfebacteria bacterium RIFCSPHIGHO2_01_FULL_48_22]|uniref:VanZ-like domain-containing protein n=2 Tax=Candidatus Wolfeibacteriota TaxID=1752735 RepID=A0A1F8DRG3_9BACT|nr:MAG: hypothetical protein A2755_02385 [Candidatus Wolfebacteria bacterium RIFCSPHIGHO2_01_FULL_48_22]OGM92274.1 MAG: hypothetical protein A2935_00685 [Candidatus Wolfebacteria bacterium RIFCSPLOWO2_01_FULL_47_17b]
MNIGTIRPVIYLFGILFVLYVLAIIFGWFDLAPWIDIPMHLLGGAWAGALFLFLGRGYILPDLYAHTIERLKLAGLTGIFGSFMGVLWEFLEFVLGQLEGFEGFAQVSVRDTLGDLCMDIVGAVLYAAIVLFVIPRIKARNNSVSQNE